MNLHIWKEEYSLDFQGDVKTYALFKLLYFILP